MESVETVRWTEVHWGTRIDAKIYQVELLQLSNNYDSQTFASIAVLSTLKASYSWWGIQVEPELNNLAMVDTC